MKDIQLIKLTTGEVFNARRADYDAARSHAAMERMKATGVQPLCHAPFVNLDFSPTGHITPCNHWHAAGVQEGGDLSVLEAWRGQKITNIRQSMLDYTLNRDACTHCVRQIELGQYDEVFAQRQFDDHATESARPPYPKRMIFRLANTCNLACIMCDGDTSSRVRAEFEKRPPLKSPYGERFFEELREVLPHLEHVEFYGGEPFLVKEQLRVLDLIAETGAKCSIYVNTNGTVLTARVKQYLETLNFKTIAVSMDAVNPELHSRIRKGLKGELYARNFEWFLDLARRRGIQLLLNVTEHRKNWFEMPEIFRLAERHKLYLHVNTCIFPVHVSLYTLPTVQLEYVLEFVEHQGWKLEQEFQPFRNRSSYDYFTSLIRNELAQRSPSWKPPLQLATTLSDGLLDPPIPGKGTFSDPDSFIDELSRINRLDQPTATRFLNYWHEEVGKIAHSPGWSVVYVELENLLAIPFSEQVPLEGEVTRTLSHPPSQPASEDAPKPSSPATWPSAPNIRDSIADQVDHGAVVLQLGRRLPTPLHDIFRTRNCRIVALVDPAVDRADSDLRAVDELIQGDLNDVDVHRQLENHQFDHVVINDLPASLDEARALLKSISSLLIPTGAVIATTTLAQGQLNAGLACAEESSALMSSVEDRQPYTDVDLEESFLSAGFAVTHLGRLDTYVMSGGGESGAQAVLRTPSSLAAEDNLPAADFVALACRLPGPPVRIWGRQINTLRRKAELAERDFRKGATARLENERVGREEMAACSEALQQLRDETARQQEVIDTLTAELERHRIASADCKTAIGRVERALAEQRNEALREVIRNGYSQLDVVKRSFSWRITMPVRVVARYLGKTTTDALLRGGSLG